MLENILKYHTFRFITVNQLYNIHVEEKWHGSKLCFLNSMGLTKLLNRNQKNIICTKIGRGKEFSVSIESTQFKVSTFLRGFQ
jgi:hypothetical protein